MNNKTAFIIQARENSTRLPGKVLLKEFNGQCLLEIIYDNIKKYFNEDVVVATGNISRNRQIVELCKKNNYKYYCGSDNNVLLRFINAAEYYDVKKIIRICSDNLFINMKY